MNSCRNFIRFGDNLNQSRMLEAWHDAQQIREESLDLFSHGIVDLKTRAQMSVCTGRLHVRLIRLHRA